MRKIFEHSFINILGQAIPMVVGLFMVPRLIHNMGTELFGTLTLVWVFIGYFSLFDLGLGRTVTHLTVEFIEKKDYNNASHTFWFSIRWMGIISAVAAIPIFWGADWITTHWLTLSPLIHSDVTRTIQILALSIPLVAWQGALRGFLEAHFRFKILNISQALSGIYTFGSPLLAWKLHPSLSSIVTFLIIGRLINFIYLFIYIYKHWRWLFQQKLKSEIKIYSRIIKMGGWLTLSNIIGPIMVYFDRFILGSFIPMGELAFYTTPYEFVWRLLILPSSLVRVLFPEFSKPSQRASVSELYQNSLKILAVIMSIPCGLIILFSHEGLNLWLGESFAIKSTFIVQILTLGIYFNSLALIPFTFIQSMEKSNWTAKLHLVELPFYLALLSFGIKYLGLNGAALVWTVRCVVDEVALTIMAPRSVQQKIPHGKLKLAIYFFSLIVLAIGLLTPSLLIKLVLALLLVISSSLFLWKNRTLFR